ncbi:deleted in malignant brain tumors 1 protein-like, partial [Anneissia japonica]|uniref:deleted in malignant brain tumors 1 protein-like n=1 Tax=Anneissia japonica TaxID=1529436 RepID=UPI0014255CB9
MRMEEIIWFLWLYCLCFTSGYWTPTYTTETPSQTTDTFLCGNGSQLITSPGYPSGYGNNMDVRWSFSTHPGSLLAIEFYDFYLESCCDWVYIISDGEEIARYNGNQLPPITVSTNNTLTVVFTSDYSVTGRGFQAEIFTYPGQSDGFCSDFNDGWCGWSHTYSSSQWRRSSGRIYGADRGNRYSSSDDYYIYVESTYSSQYGYLDSQMIPSTWSDVCLKFYFYMSGSYNYINIYQIKNYNSYYVFSVNDDYSSQWKHVSVNFANLANSYIRLIGRAYGYYYSTEMVAVDDIYISKGTCSDFD